jgi:glycine cleavage system H protein
MTVPSELKYAKSHEWAKVNGNVVTVGITEYAQTKLGDLVFAELPAVGEVVQAGDSCTTLESTKAASDVYSPVAGKVIAVNDNLVGSPELVNQAPYSDGWLFQVELSGDLPETLLSAEAYQKQIDSEE